MAAVYDKKNTDIEAFIECKLFSCEASYGESVSITSLRSSDYFDISLQKECAYAKL